MSSRPQFEENIKNKVKMYMVKLILKGGRQD
jgi:hypothetical protein